jgi:hypothetical protein
MVMTSQPAVAMFHFFHWQSFSIGSLVCLTAGGSTHEHSIA